MQRVLSVLVLLVAFLPATSFAGVMKVWGITDPEQAPVLIVGRVRIVRKEFPVAPGAGPWNGETWAMAANVKVIRSYSSSGQVLKPDSTIAIRFFADGPGQTIFINRAALPGLTPGEVLMIPLQPSEAPAREPWILLGKEGIGLTVPVRATLDASLPQPHTGRQFIVREIANSLSHGTPEETSTAGGYVHDQFQNLTSELMPLLRQAIGADERRWATVLVDLMGAQRPTLDDLRAGNWRDANWNPSADHGYSLASAILRKLPDTVRSDRLIIDAVLDRMSFSPESATLLARDYAHDDYFISALEAALQKRQPGSAYVALSLIDHGYKVFVPYALAAAGEIVEKPAAKDETFAERRDKEAAASLLRQ